MRIVIGILLSLGNISLACEACRDRDLLTAKMQGMGSSSIGTTVSAPEAQKPRGPRQSADSDITTSGEEMPAFFEKHRSFIRSFQDMGK